MDVTSVCEVTELQCGAWSHHLCVHTGARREQTLRLKELRKAPPPHTQPDPPPGRGWCTQHPYSRAGGEERRRVVAKTDLFPPHTSHLPPRCSPNPPHWTRMGTPETPRHRTGPQGPHGRPQAPQVLLTALGAPLSLRPATSPPPPPPRSLCRCTRNPSDTP